MDLGIEGTPNLHAFELLEKKNEVLDYVCMHACIYGIDCYTAIIAIHCMCSIQVNDVIYIILYRGNLVSMCRQKDRA